jgi:hypothetical protein
MVSSYFKRLITPGAVPQFVVIIVSYLSILAIFLLDLASHSEILLQVFYFFPLILISFHCERKAPVIGAVVITFVLQVFTLLTYHMSVTSTIIEMSMVLWSDVLVASVSRYARANLKENLRRTAGKAAQSRQFANHHDARIGTNQGEH